MSDLIRRADAIGLAEEAIHNEHISARASLYMLRAELTALPSANAVEVKAEQLPPKVPTEWINDGMVLVPQHDWVEMQKKIEEYASADVTETDGVITIEKQSAKDVGEIKHIIIRSPNYTRYFYNESMPLPAEAVQGKESGSKLDLISRADAIDAVCDKCPISFKDKCEWKDNGHCSMKDALEALTSAEAVQGWIPFKTRPLTDEEKQEHPDWTYTFDCPLPDDEEEILLSNGKYVWTDTFINDGECYLDGGDDIDDGMAWMPLPKPYEPKTERRG